VISLLDSYYSILPSSGKKKSGLKPLALAIAQLSIVFDQFIAILELDLEYQIFTRPDQVPDLSIQFFGFDVKLLTTNDADLLHSLRDLSIAVRAPDRPELLSCTIAKPNQRRLL
jgi:hypothetical protein